MVKFLDCLIAAVKKCQIVVSGGSGNDFLADGAEAFFFFTSLVKAVSRASPCLYCMLQRIVMHRWNNIKFNVILRVFLC